jgi:MFS transporter, DHA3 family, macrolide efflux protein
MQGTGWEGSGWRARFFAIWSGQAFSLVGSGLVQFALVWWLAKASGSATVLALGTLLSLLPQILLGPIAGACVDRWNRRMVMIVADGAIALGTVVLGVLFWLGWVQTWHIYAIMLLRAIGGTFHWPAMSASTPLMVPDEQLTRVAGMNQTLQGVMSIITPPLGALAMSAMPLYGVLAIDVLTATIAILPLCFISVPQPRRLAVSGVVGGKVSLWGDMLAGLRYVWSWPGLLAICALAMVINFLLMPAFALLPILVSKHFRAEALQLGWLESAFGAGIIAGGVLLSAWGGFKRRMSTSMLGVAGTGLGVLLVGLAPAQGMGVALAGMLLAGVAMPIANGPLFAVVQGTVDPAMLGRVMTLIGAATSAAAPLGVALAGPLADAIGARFWFIVGGILCAGMAALAMGVPAIAHLEEQAATLRSARTVGGQPMPAVVGEPQQG